MVELADVVKSVDGVPDVDSVLLVWSEVGRPVDRVALAEVLALEETAEVGSTVVAEDWAVKMLLMLGAVSEIEVVLVLVVLPQRRRTARGDAKAKPRLAKTTRCENSILVNTNERYQETKCSSQL